MKKQPYPISQLTGGLNVAVDAAFLTDKESPNLKMVRFHKGLLKKDVGFSSFGDANERVMLIDNYYKLAGGSYPIAVTVDKAYQYTGTPPDYAAISGAAAVFTGDEDDQFCSTTYEDLFIVTNGKDAIQKWNGAAWAALGGMAGPPAITAKCLAPYYSHLVLGHTIEAATACPHRIRWSDTGDPEDWTTGTAGYFDLNDTVDWVVTLVPMSDRLYIFKERSIWELIYVGGTRIYTARMVVDGVGTYAPNSVHCLGDEIIFFGSDNVYMFDGTPDLRGLGDSLYPLLYDTESKIVNLTKINRASSLHTEETEDYLLVLPTISDEPDWMIKYNLGNKNWSQRALSATCLGYYSVGNWEAWNDVVGTWNAQTGSWFEQSLPPGAPTTLIGKSDGTVVEDNRLTKSDELFVWESKDFIFGHAARITEFRYLVRGDSFDVSYSTDQGRSWSAEITLTPDADNFKELVHYVNFTALHVRCRIRTYNQNIEVKWLEPWFIPRARSKTLEV